MTLGKGPQAPQGASEGQDGPSGVARRTAIPFNDPGDAPPADIQAALLGELERLTAALHANQCHPDFTYAITTGGTQIPPNAGQWGTGWEPNPDCPGHGRGTKPANTWWCWRRHRTTEETS